MKEEIPFPLVEIIQFLVKGVPEFADHSVFNG